MSSKSAEKTYSISSAMEKLGKAVQIVSANSELYYLKKASQITETALREVDSSFDEISSLMSEFAEHWYGSRKQGPDAVPLSDDLNDRIDIKLCQNGKLDFEQMKRIMFRLNGIDEALMGLDRLSYYLKSYQELCREKRLGELVEHAQFFENSILNELRRSIESEAKRLRNQIERCNLYYQPAMKNRTLWVALGSLAISCLAFLLTILKMLNFI
jgi:hypothetical protein